MRNITGNMGEQPDWSVKYAKCIVCGTGTRSHILEMPEYEPYLQETRPREYEDEEGVEAVKKWEMVVEASVCCHRCWMDIREKTFKKARKELPEWTKEPLPNSQRIKSFLNRWVEYGFGEDEPDEEMNLAIEGLKESIRRSARGE